MTETQCTNRTGPSEESLLAVYSAQWQDLHHCREQDWRLCNLLVLGVLGVGALKIIGEFPQLQSIGSLVFAGVSMTALGVTVRHNSLFKEKMAAIQEIEKVLNVPNLFKNKIGWKKVFKVQYLLMIIYVLFAAFFLYLALGGPPVPVPGASP